VTDVLGILLTDHYHGETTMFITYLRNGRRETHAAFSRNLAFVWVWASEGEDITILGYHAARQVAA
jgi:hypothetical protein